MPLYHQLSQLLARRISRGTYAEGARIPSEHELAATFLIGRPTVRQATDHLVSRGVLVRRRGAGTFVRPTPQQVDLFSLGGTIASFQEQGIEVCARFLGAPKSVKLSESASAALESERGIRIERLSRVKRRSVLFERMFFDPELFAGLGDLELEQQSLSSIVQDRFFMSPRSASQNFRVCHAEGAVARHLGMKVGEPLLYVQRALHFAARDSAIFCELYCRTDHMVFSQKITNNAGGSPDHHLNGGRRSQQSGRTQDE
ncbi:MAG: GntR family transcriptional regulator [Polyangiaceae bacterium]|nr:GntR family transcriptional regulator [Polyangiaceae bacterium]